MSMYLSTYIHVCYGVLASLTFCRNNVQCMYMCIHICLGRLHIQDQPHQEKQATLRSKDIEISDRELPWRHTSIHLCMFHASLYSLLQRRVAIFAILSKQCVRMYICVYAYTYATTCCRLWQSVETMHVRGYLYTYIQLSINRISV